MLRGGIATLREVRTAQLRVIAELSNRSLSSVYEAMRLPGSPSPVAHISCVPMYDVAEVLTFLQGKPGLKPVDFDRPPIPFPTYNASSEG